MLKYPKTILIQSYVKKRMKNHMSNQMSGKLVALLLVGLVVGAGIGYVLGGQPYAGWYSPEEYQTAAATEIAAAAAEVNADD